MKRLAMTILWPAFLIAGVLEVKQRQVRVLDESALRQLVNGNPC